MARPFLKGGGSGDLRAFQTALGASVFLTVYTILLLLTTPFLSNYAVMNLGLFLVLFAFGFFTARIPGINFWMQLGYLTISAFVGLNPQEPVASQTIINTSLGLMFGIWIGTLVGRLLWPVLPHSPGLQPWETSNKAVRPERARDGVGEIPLECYRKELGIPVG
jgi:hypothetical protein